MVWNTFFTLLFKWLVCGLRPHFLDVCKPDLTKAEGSLPHYDLTTDNGYGFNSRMHTRAICTFNSTTQTVGIFKTLISAPSDLDYAMTSFPSGHASNSFASFTFLALYTAGKLRTAKYKNQWKVLLTLSPIAAALVISCSVLIDHYHNWYDVLFGAVLGAVCGWFAYHGVFGKVAGAGNRAVEGDRPDRPIGEPERVPAKSGSMSLEDVVAKVAA
jgi:diacylglycerol diphosphate phosphatase / phosphatidate phosphatase